MRDADGHLATELVAGAPQSVHYVPGTTANQHIRTVLLGSHDDAQPAPQSEPPEVAAQRLITNTATKIAAARDRLEEAVALAHRGSNEPVLCPGQGINPDLAGTMSDDLSALQRMVNRHAEDEPHRGEDPPDGWLSPDQLDGVDLFDEVSLW
jgi:hypothetical protein